MVEEILLLDKLLHILLFVLYLMTVKSGNKFKPPAIGHLLQLNCTCAAERDA